MAEENNQEEGKKSPIKLILMIVGGNCPSWSWNRCRNPYEWRGRYRPIVRDISDN